ncbi:MAG: hypothetical protein LBL93_04760 [Ruminococcus sp.]|jgi:hypothetical protein|nr:hypothetical protein [Ruminococcus sp.]
MSPPRPPYYWKKDSDTYHWEKSCSNVPANVSNNPDWEVGNSYPKWREQCDECKSPKK